MLTRSAEQRVEELEWYFLPLEEQQKKDFATPALQLMKQMKKNMMKELDDIRGRHSKRDMPIEVLRDRLVEALRNLPDSNKEAVAYQLQGLMQSLESASFPIKSRMWISVTLVENVVDPEIVRELRILTEILLEDSLHFMHTPESVVLSAMRDVDEEKNKPENQNKKRSELLSFRDALLNRLAKVSTVIINCNLTFHRCEPKGWGGPSVKYARVY
jgi:hypothetical protein